MVSLVIRKSLKSMVDYLGDDFDSRMWVDESGERIAHPRIGGLLPRKRSVDAWRELGSDEFRSIATGLDTVRRKGGVLAVELGFAPPKSLSIAALADVRVFREIIDMHRAAVDDSLALISALLVAREKGQLSECGVRLMEFLHPWNRGTEPQLHSHILVVRDPNYSHALWTTPIFLIQRTLREVYHYSLCARLLAGEYQILHGERGDLAWELQGIPARIVRGFSERSAHLKAIALASPRGYFSQGAEFRVAGLASRRQLPKTDPSVSLGELRAVWRRRLPLFNLLGQSPRVETVEIDLPRVFRMSSVLTREQFIGQHLRWWLGARASLSEAVTIADRILRAHVEAKNLNSVGRGYCFPKNFETEDALRNEITSGFDGHEPLHHTNPQFLRDLEKDILAQPRSIKVISSSGEPVMDTRRLRTASNKPFSGQVLHLGHWDSAEVLKNVLARQGKPLLVTVEEPFAVGDFGHSLVRLQLAGRFEPPEPGKPSKILGRRAVVTAATKPTPKGILALMQNMLGRDDNRTEREVPELAVSLLPRKTPEEIRDMNWSRLLKERKKGGTELVLFRRVPWERLFRGDWKDLEIFAFSNTILPVPKKSKEFLRTIRQKTVWSLIGAPVEGVIPVVGVTRKKGLRVEALQALLAGGEQEISLIEPVRVSMERGTPLLTPIRFESENQVFPAGEVRFFDHVDHKGNVWFSGGQYWPSARLVMDPAFYVRQLPKQQKSLPALVVQPVRHGDRMKWFSALPPAELTIIESEDPKGYCEDLERDLRIVSTAKIQSAVARSVNGDWIMDLDCLFEPPAIWRKMILANQTPTSPQAREIRETVSPQEPMEEASPPKTSTQPSLSFSSDPAVTVQTRPQENSGPQREGQPQNGRNEQSEMSPQRKAPNRIEVPSKKKSPDPNIV